MVHSPDGKDVAEVDWATAASTQPGRAQWAAFLSNCSHEAGQAGHRVMLTYNLYQHPPPKPKDGPQFPGLNPSSTSLHAKLTKALRSPGFMPKGGMLAFALEH